MPQTITPPKTVKTRKEHLCNTCHRRFPPGSQMKSAVYTQDGEIYRWRTCTTCTKLLSKYPDCFEDPVMNAFPDGCVNEGPVNLFMGDRRKEFKEDPTPEHLLQMLNKYAD